jgi:putative transposase
VEFSVQDDHLHLIVEAYDNDALARGMKSFSVRANRLFNAALGRGRGQVWGDRYHRRDLTNARQVRNALVYCLQNYKKHQRIQGGASRIDPCSSARWFQGWTAIRQHDDGPRPTEEAHTVLLAKAWQKHGFIHPGEAPRAPN